ncbi:MAG TPA: hypothetical protein VGE27_19405 [Gemmatimonas sp.]|uniref:hypothetical protein n=1 Tax=Gemmatimonas sp. TaxID=1962908 RepID=UPI002ED8AB67
MHPVPRLLPAHVANHRSAIASSSMAVFVLLLSACGGGPVVTPASTPTPTPDAPPAVRVTTARLTLPARIASNWQVSTVARMTATDLRPSDARPSTEVRTDPRGEIRGEQRIESRAIVSWTMDRSATGALRATGQVDSFTVRSTLDALETQGQRRDARTGATAATPNRATPPATTRPALLLLDAVFDSSVARVVTRPLLANECDRPELGAVALAKDVLIRIPEGVAVGDRWRDSTVSLVCRTGIPITVYTTTQHQLERLDDQRAVIIRTMSGTMEGKGGSAFRGLELTGVSSGTQRAEVLRSTGVLEKLEGTSTLTLQVSERTPSGAPRAQQIVQRMELKAERVAR